MASPASSLASHICEQLTPEALLSALGIDPSATVAVGGMIRAHCPLCGNQAIKTLFLNPDNRTYGCRYTRCPGHSGGDFVQLVALARNISLTEAARQLIGELGLTVPEEAAAGLGQELEAQGLEALGMGDLEGARRLLEEAAAARGKDSDNGTALSPDVAAKLAHCCWELGDHEGARRRYRQIIQDHRSSGEVHTAILLISDLIHVDHEWAPELHLILGGLLLEEGESTQALNHFLKAADGLRRLGQSQLAAEASAAAAEIDPDSDPVRRALVESALVNQDWETALENLEGFLRCVEKEGDESAGLLALERLDSAGQLPLPLRLRRAALCNRAGRTDLAESIVEQIEIASDDCEETAEQLLAFLADQSERPLIWEMMIARLEIRLGRWEALRSTLTRLRAAESAPGLEETVGQCLEALSGAQPGDLAVRHEWLSWRTAQGEGETLLRDAQALLCDAAEAKEAEIAEATWRWVRDHTGSDPERLADRASAIVALWGVTHAPQHQDEWASTVREALESDLPELAIELGDRHLREVEFNITVARDVITAAHRLGRLSEKRDLADQLIEAQRSQGDHEGAEQTLRMMIEGLDTDECEPLWALLAEILQEAGKADAAITMQLMRAENLLSAGRTKQAEKHLAAARRGATDRWQHWRAERAVVRRVGHTQMATKLLSEALSAIEKGSADAPDALAALNAEAEEGLLDAETQTQLITRMAKRGEEEQAETLLVRGESTLGHRIQGQRALVDLLEQMPRSRAAWGFAIERVNDDESVESLLRRLVTLCDRSEMSAEDRLHLAEQAAKRWSDRPQTLEALARSQGEVGDVAASRQTLRRWANCHRESGEPQHAAEILERLCEEEPADDSLMTLLAEVLEEAGENQRAAQKWLEVGRSLMVRGAMPGEVREALDRARQVGGETAELLAVEFRHFEQALKDMDVDEATGQVIALAERGAGAGKGEAALALVRQCIERFGESMGLLRAQAQALEGAGQTTAAVRAWRAVLDRLWEQSEWRTCDEVLAHVERLDPNDTVDLERRAELAWRLGRLEEADDRLTTLCDQSLKEGDWEKAAAVLGRAARWSDDPRPHLARLAELQHEHQRIDEAVASLRRIIVISLERGEVAEAEARLERLVAWAPNDCSTRLALIERFRDHWDTERLVDAYRELIQMHRERGEAEEALTLCRRALDRSPDSPSLLTVAADLSLDLGQEGAAMEALRTLAESATEQGDRAEAVRAWQRLVELPSSTVDDRWSLVELLVAEGAKAQALDHLRALAEHHGSRDEKLNLIRAYEWMIEIEPGHTGALNSLAETCAACGDLGGATRRWLELAEVHLARNRRAPAERAFRQILEHDPDSVAALEGLLSLYEQQQNTRRLIEVACHLLSIHAAQDFRRAEALVADMVERHPDADEFFRRWAETLWERGRRDEAVQELESRVERLRSEGRTSTALEMLQHLASYLPERLDLPERIAEIAFEMGDRERARRAWTEALTGHRALGDIDRELAVLRALQRLDPEDIEITSSLVEAAINLGHTEEALESLSSLLDHHRQGGNIQAQQRVLERILELDASRADDQRALGEIHLAAGRRQRAAEHLRQALAHYRLEERWPEAAETAKRVCEIDPSDSSSQQLRGEALAQAGRTADAITVFTALGTSCQADRDHLMAEMAWRAVIDLVPDHIVAREQLASILAAQGQSEEALAVWEGLAATHREEGNSEAERQVLRSILTVNPDSIAAHRRVATLSLEANDIEGAWLSFRELLQTADMSGEDEQWRSLEAELLEASPDPRLRIRLAQMHSDAGRMDEALMLYSEVAELHRRSGNAASVRATCQLMLALDPHHIRALELLLEVLPELRDQTGTSETDVKRRLARALTAHGQSKRALPLLQELAAESPEDFEVRADLTRHHQAQGQREAFEKSLDRCVQVLAHATDRTPLLDLCRELLESTPWPRSVRERMVTVIQAMQRVERHTDVFLALAEDCERDGDIVRAVEIYQSLLAAMPEETRLRLRFIEFLQEHGQNTRAVHELLVLGEIHRDQGDTKRELAALERARELDSENIQVLHSLGRALLSSNARGRALEHLQRAAKLASDQGQMAAMPDLYREILDIDPSDVPTRRTYIDVLLSTGQTDEAIEQNLRLVDQCMEKGFLDLAAQCLRAVVQLQPSNLQARVRLIETHLQFGAEEDLLPDFLAAARLELKAGRHREAAQWFQRYLRLASRDLEVRREYIETYEKVATPADVAKECQAMAEMCEEAGRNREAESWRGKAQRAAQQSAKPSPRAQASSPSKPDASKAAPASQERRLAAPRSSRTAAGASRKREENETQPPTTREEQLERSLRVYLSHLESDPRNAKVHCQVAELMRHLGRDSEALKHLCTASELLLEAGECDACIALCERLLKSLPSDAALTKRLRDARMMRAQMGILDDVLDETDRDQR
ncbi:tetratricopeptide repeat protein [Candidatus Sumerlaeota bacterium]|nr:tetratricopeptide repeat protein [Candidatus Sumerlaeota bacterium]